MFVNDNLDHQLDQMRWEYERAMWQLAQNQKQRVRQRAGKKNQTLKAYD